MLKRLKELQQIPYIGKVQMKRISCGVHYFKFPQSFQIIFQRFFGLIITKKNSKLIDFINLRTYFQEFALHLFSDLISLSHASENI